MRDPKWRRSSSHCTEYGSAWFNQGEAIRNSLGGLRNAGLYGGVLAVAVLLFFLRRWRTTLVVATAIPFSLLVTCGAMFALGSQFNVLTLLGLMLGVGMLVDNAVVVLENIFRHLQRDNFRRFLRQSETKEAILDLIEKINEGGTTVVMVTHDPELANRASRQIHLLDGRLIDLDAAQPATQREIQNPQGAPGS